jgi:hypothetical protein
MMTVADRLAAADQFMPAIGVKYETRETKHSDGLWRTEQHCVRDGRPSASMVLRAAYGSMACKYDDMAPSGPKLLKAAQKAYCDAAEAVPARKRVTQRERLERRLDRLIAELGS